MGFLKKQLLDSIQWLDDSRDTMVYMYPIEDQEIQHGAQLTVRPGQAAVFVEKGQIADVFGPGTHKPSFKSDVFFVNTKEMIGNKWGTPGPIWISDPQFGQVQVRAFGTYTFSITEPKQFIEVISSTNKKYTKELINTQLKEYIINHFSDAIGSLNVTVAQIASKYNEISTQMIKDVGESFRGFGLSLNTFTIGNISLPEELEKSLRELTDMNIHGSVTADRLGKIKSLRQLDIMGQGIQTGVAQSAVASEIVSSGIERACQNCGHTVGEMAKFCNECGAKIEKVKPKMKFCKECGMKVEEGAKFCNECGTKL